MGYQKQMKYENTLDKYLDNVLGRMADGKLSKSDTASILAQSFSYFFSHDHDVREQVFTEMKAVLYLDGEENAHRT